MQWRVHHVTGVALLTGTSTDNCVMFMYCHPRRDTQLVDGGLLYLSARAEGRGDVSLQWLREGHPIAGALGPALRIQVNCQPSTVCINARHNG